MSAVVRLKAFHECRTTVAWFMHVFGQAEDGIEIEIEFPGESCCTCEAGESPALPGEIESRTRKDGIKTASVVQMQGAG